jgi:hypothetical protein
MKRDRVVPTSIVDSNVLIYAIRAPRREDTEVHRQMCRDSKSLLMTMDSIGVSAITITEVFPYLTPAELAEPVFQKLHVFGLGPAASQEASRVIRAKLGSPDTCRSCLGLIEPRACKKCKLSVGRQQALNDIYVYATASAEDDVDVLYSYDLDELKPFARNVDIAKPPNANGTLFAQPRAVAEPAETEEVKEAKG